MFLRLKGTFRYGITKCIWKNRFYVTKMMELQNTVNGINSFTQKIALNIKKIL